MEEELGDAAGRVKTSEPKISGDETSEAEAHIVTTRAQMTLLDRPASHLSASRAGLFRRAYQDIPQGALASAQRRYKSSEVIVFRCAQPRVASPHGSASQIRSHQCVASRIKAQDPPASREQNQGLGEGAAKTGRETEAPSGGEVLPDAASLSSRDSVKPKGKVERDLCCFRAVVTVLM